MTTPKKMNILFVDDSPNLRKIAHNYLKTAFDFNFFEANNGDQALQIVQEQHFIDDAIDLVILDWMMPYFSGYDFLRALRDVDFLKSEPHIIMLTAETYAHQINACLKYGVSSYITKPFTQNDLIEAVRKVIEQKKGIKNAV